MNCIEYIISDSFYESFSNVVVEAKFSGNNIISCKECNNTIYNSLFDLNILIICGSIDTNNLKEQNDYIKYFNNINVKLYFLILSQENSILNSTKQIKIIDFTKKHFVNDKIKHIISNMDMINNVIINSNLFEVVKNYEFSKYFNNVLYSENDINKIIKFDIIKKIFKIFINYEPINGPYGGGNQFVINLVEFIKINFSNIIITFNLEDDIDIYFIIDIRKGSYKKYAFNEIVNHKKHINKKSDRKIVYRINDCDLTRENKSLEKLIIDNQSNIDYWVFNSDFILEYYKNFVKNNFNNYKIIYNTANSKFFYPIDKIFNKEKIIIVTHHWSDNINKGYEIYHKLYEYSKTVTNIEFRFVGRKFNDQFVSDIKVYGPYKEMELGNCLREADLYITASIYDACPMHVLEGISCGLPILYLDHIGGAKDICEMADSKIGESFIDFNDLIKKINIIADNYEFYKKNIKDNLKLYNSDFCYKEFVKTFLYLGF